MTFFFYFSNPVHYFLIAGFTLPSNKSIVINSGKSRELVTSALKIVRKKDNKGSEVDGFFFSPSSIKVEFVIEMRFLFYCEFYYKFLTE